MTDEEKAEEWVKNNGFPYDDCPIIRNKLKRTFLAGLKVGRPKWHDLRKDPNDLPKQNTLLDRSDVVITDVGIGHYNHRKQKWYVHHEECNLSFSERIVAWAEIPKFEEK